MSTGWTAPGSTGQPAGHEPGPANGSGGPAPQPTTGPQRELVQQVPLFPLRPLNVGEVLGAAVRIYRVRPKPVLGLAAAVYGIAFVLITLATGAGMIPLVARCRPPWRTPPVRPPRAWRPWAGPPRRSWPPSAPRWSP